MCAWVCTMALLTATLAYGGQWEIADLPFAIPFPRHPQLVGDARIAWQPHIVFPGYEYPLKPGTSSEYPSELDNFKAIAEQGSTASPMFSSQVTLTEEQLFAYGFQLETSPPPDHHLPADLEPESLSDNDPSDADSQAFETRTDLEQPDSNPDQALKIDVNILNLDKDEAHDASSASSKSDLDRSPMTIAHNDANRSPGDTSHPHTATGDETTPQADAACEQTNPHTCECGRSIPISPTATKADGQKRPPLSPSPPTAGESRPNPAPTPTPGTSATTFDDFDCYLTESLPAISAGGPAAPEQSASIQQVNWDLPEETNADATAPRSKTAADPPPTSAKPRSESGLFERQHSSLRQSSTARVVSNQPSPFDSRRSGFSKPLSSDGRHSFTARQQFAADGSLLSYPHQKPGSSHGAPIDLEMSADEKRFFEYQTDGPYPNQSQRMAAHRANRYMSEAGVLTSDPNMVVRYRVPAGLHDGSPVLVVAVPYTEVQRRRHQRTSTLASGEIRDKTILTAPMGILVDNAQVVPKVEADAPVDSDADGSGPESSVESHIVNDRHRPTQISRSDRFASHANQPALSKASSFSQLDVIEKQSRTQELMYATPQVGSPTKKSVSKFQKVLSRLSLLKKSKQEKSDKESGSGSAASLSRQQRY